MDKESASRAGFGPSVRPDAVVAFRMELVPFDLDALKFLVCWSPIERRVPTRDQREYPNTTIAHRTLFVNRAL